MVCIGTDYISLNFCCSTRCNSLKRNDWSWFDYSVLPWRSGVMSFLKRKCFEATVIWIIQIHGLQIPPLIAIPVPPRMVKQNSWQCSWSLFESADFRSLSSGERVSASWQYQHHNYLKTTQGTMQYHTNHLRPTYCQQAQILWAWAGTCLICLIRIAISSLAAENCRWASKPRLACYFLPCSSWPSQPHNIGLDGDPGGVQERFGMNKVYPGTKSFQLVIGWARYLSTVNSLNPFKSVAGPWLLNWWNAQH